MFLKIISVVIRIASLPFLGKLFHRLKRTVQIEKSQLVIDVCLEMVTFEVRLEIEGEEGAKFRDRTSEASILKDWKKYVNHEKAFVNKDWKEYINDGRAFVKRAYFETEVKQLEKFSFRSMFKKNLK